MKTFFLMVAAVLAMAGGAQAQVVASVSNLSGVLTARHADGKTILLSVKSEVEQGDTLITESNTFARLKFIDASEIVLRPGSEVRVDKFSFAQDKPESDGLVISMIKGSMRAVSGLLGKRNHAAVQYVTPTATIGIRGTIWDAYQIEPGKAEGSTDTKAKQLESGLYVSVVDGSIFMRNAAGSADYAIGQFGFAKDMNSAPVVLPANPGLTLVLPPAFAAGTDGRNQGSDKDGANANCAVK